MQIFQQHRNIALSFNIQATQSHTKPTGTTKLTRYFTATQREEIQLHPQNTKASFPNQETLRTTHPTSSTGRNLHNKEEPQTARIPKGHPKHSNLNKMKRQRNTQQVKGRDKCTPNQTKQEIGNLPEKEFRIMIVKMIPNLENKMELQINSLDTRIEKIQEMFNKDLEEINNSINNE